MQGEPACDGGRVRVQPAYAPETVLYRAVEALVHVVVVEEVPYVRLHHVDEPGATEFQVSITHNVKRGTSFSYIPKPILAKLGNPEGLKFVMRGDEIIVIRPD